MTRSEEMQYVTITIPNELVTETVNALGDFGMLHIVDLSTSNEMSKHQFAYKKRTTEVADLEKKLKGFEDQMVKRGIPIAIEDFETPLGAFAEVAYQRNPDVVLGAADFAAEYEVQLTSNLAFERSVQTEIARRQELRVTLTESDKLIPAGASAGADDIESAGASHTYERFMASMSNQSVEREGNGISSYICGVIPVTNQSVFTRLVYRTSRGSNAVVKFSESPVSLIDPNTGDNVKKVVFCVVTIGAQLYKRILKICPLVNATVYPVPSGQPALVAQEIARLDSEIREQQQALQQTSTTITRILSALADPQQVNGSWGPCPLRLWQQVLFREKVMIDTLMKCEFHSTLVFMGGWCPVEKLEDLSYTLASASQGSGAKPALDRNATPPKKAIVPPTYVHGNKFTESFQAIINTYGFPKYGEFNPGLFTIVLFPFLFGVMYGDVGHGCIIALVGALFVFFEKSLTKASKEKRLNEMIDMVFSGRYVILLMGLFAIYCGIIYNDVMSIPMNIYGSNFHHEGDGYVWNGEVYPFGMDPGWYHKKNSLKFFNSFKMKMAVTIGVIQMTFGMLLSLYNHVYFNDMISVYFEFLPRILFFLCIFGYMIAMIFIKWCTDWVGLGRNAPNLIQTMIDMFLSPGSVAEENLLYEGQAVVQAIFLLVAVACIPMMLLPKPFIEQGKRKGGCKMFSSCHSPADDEYQAHHNSDHSSDDIGLTSQMHDHEHEHEGEHAVEEHEEHSFGDVMIHQSIHTIEFILGSVSNTASYLRLWALSLAHAQLAEVFWEKMVAEYGYENSGIITFAGTAVWAVATFGVIICMDALECYLHALRLIWVEWNSKYYAGTGYCFSPFVFKRVE